MEQKYLITTKQEFSSLYRFGSIPVISHFLVDFIEDEKEQREAFISKFMDIPYFLGDEEYLILKIESESITGRIQMPWVKMIIPITAAAKVSLESKFNPKLKFNDPIFEELIREIEHLIDIKDRFKGADSIMEMFFPESKTPIFFDEQELEGALLLRMDGKKSNEAQGSFYVNLLLYERYEFFPNSDLGFFYDIGEIFAHSKGRPSFKGSKLHNYLEANKIDLVNHRLSVILKAYQESIETEPFRNQLFANEIQSDIVGLFFLKLKAEFLEKEDLDKTSIKKTIEFLESNNRFTKEFKCAVYLIGLFFGFNKIYEDYYDHIGLSVFKPKPKIEKLIVITEEEDPITNPQSEGFSIGDKVELITNNPGSENPKTNQLLIDLMAYIGDKKVSIEKENAEQLKIIFKRFDPKTKWNIKNMIAYIKDHYSENFEFPTKTSVKMAPPIR